MHEGGLLEPLYRLHASRLKLLLCGAAPLGLLARHCFAPELTEELRARAAQQGAAEGTATAVADPELAPKLLEDCLQALAFCLEEDKNFHKARYRLGMAYKAQARYEDALQELRVLFQKNKNSLFSINVWDMGDHADAQVSVLYVSVSRVDC